MLRRRRHFRCRYAGSCTNARETALLIVGCNMGARGLKGFVHDELRKEKGCIMSVKSLIGENVEDVQWGEVGRGGGH